MLKHIILISKKVNIKQKFSKITEYWAPKVLAEMNDYQFKIAKIKGEFIWHNHKHTDEVFIVIEGEMKIEFHDKILNLSEGDLYVVHKGEEHKPCSERECKIMLVEPKGVIITGNEINSLNAENDQRV